MSCAGVPGHAPPQTSWQVEYRPFAYPQTVPVVYPAQGEELQDPQGAPPVLIEGVGARNGSSVLSHPAEGAAGAMKAGAPAEEIVGVTAGVAAPAREAISSRAAKVRNVDRQVIRSPFLVDPKSMVRETGFRAPWVGLG
jgi:hypothetical protein